MSRASTELPNVVGLVFIAAFGLDEGESVLSVQEPFPATMLGQAARPSPYAAPGAAGGPDLFIDHGLFRGTFGADLPVDQAAVLAVSQRPVAAATLDAKLDRAPGWRTTPSWYLVSEHDRTIDPHAEAFMAERMGATTATIDGSHLAFVSRPVAVARPFSTTSTRRGLARATVSRTANGLHLPVSEENTPGAARARTRELDEVVRCHVGTVALGLPNVEAHEVRRRRRVDGSGAAGRLSRAGAFPGHGAGPGHVRRTPG